MAYLCYMLAQLSTPTLSNHIDTMISHDSALSASSNGYVFRRREYEHNFFSVVWYYRSFFSLQDMRMTYPVAKHGQHTSINKVFVLILVVTKQICQPL